MDASCTRRADGYQSSPPCNFLLIYKAGSKRGLLAGPHRQKKFPASDRCSTSLRVRLPSARPRFSSKLRGMHYGDKGSVETKLKLPVASNRSARDRPMRRCAAAGAWGAASCGSGGAPLSRNCSAWVPIAGVR
jgi:hypothetical protein